MLILGGRNAGNAAASLAASHIAASLHPLNAAPSGGHASVFDGFPLSDIAFLSETCYHMSSISKYINTKRSVLVNPNAIRSKAVYSDFACFSRIAKAHFGGAL